MASSTSERIFQGRRGLIASVLNRRIVASINSTRSGARSTTRSWRVAAALLPRTAPVMPSSRISRSTVRRATGALPAQVVPELSGACRVDDEVAGMERVAYATDLSDAVGVDRAAGHRAEAGTDGAVGDRGSGLVRPARGRERAALPEPDGLSVAASAARPPSLVGGVLLLHPVAPGRPCSADPGDPAVPGAGAGQTIGGPVPGDHRHPVRPCGGRGAEGDDGTGREQEDARQEAGGSPSTWRA